VDEMQLYRQLALLTDAEAKRCLDWIVRVYGAQNSDLRKLLGTEQALAACVIQAAQLANLGSKVPRVEETSVKNQSAAIREILVQIAATEQRRADLIAWFKEHRNTLFDPITAALVLAGIVFVLQLDIKVEVNDGKVSGHVQKAPTDSKLLEKFFSLFK
jgi:hypothetical protein